MTDYFQEEIFEDENCIPLSNLEGFLIMEKAIQHDKDQRLQGEDSLLSKNVFVNFYTQQAKFENQDSFY